MEFRTLDDKRNHRREMLVDGEVVCWLTLIDYQMRIGAAQVRMAGIAGVETKEQHRMKSYMRYLFNDTLVYMQTEGYDVSMLFGIPNFYPKFGYATCMTNTHFALKTRVAEQASAQPLTARALTADDVPYVIDMYNAHNAARTCSIVRTAEHFTGFPIGSGWWRKAESAILLDAAGDRCGYAAWDKHNDDANIIELECASPAHYASALAACAQIAIPKLASQITFHMPLDHPFAVYARRFGARWTVEYPHDADGMLRIVNQASLFEKIMPELQHRAAAGKPGWLTLRTELGDLALHFSEPSEHVGAMNLPQHVLAQLLCGYRDSRDVLADPAVRAEGAVSAQLDTLFPCGHAYVWHADHF